MLLSKLWKLSDGAVIILGAMMIAVLVLMTIIYVMIRGEDAKTILIAFAKCVGTSILGCIFSTIILNIDLSVRGLSSASRLAMFDVKEIFSAFLQRVPYVYEKYMNILKTPLMHRNIIYLAIIIVTIVALIIIGIGLIREKHRVRTLLIVPMVLLIPMASNLIGILIPYNGVNSMMQY